MTPHKATPERWSRVQDWVDDGGSSTDSCILELGDRIAALEAAASAPPDHVRDATEMVPAPAGGLVERVAEHIVESMVISDREAARAAILTVAEWLDNGAPMACPLTARWLREEVQRHD